jgi:DNA-binding response OmpR family regulator
MEPAERPGSLQVLIVEDDPLIRRAVTRALRGAGHEVVAVERCGRARGLGRAFDVAVLDLELPDGTGVDVAGELLGLGTAEGVVFFSGAADPSLLVRAAQLGEVVAKSGDLGTLLQAISAARTSAALVRRGSQPRPRTARR